MTQEPIRLEPTPYPPQEPESIPPLDYSYPVEPEKKDNKTLIIILVVAAVLLLCCCCGGISWYFWEHGDDIMQDLGVMLPLFLA